MCRDCILLCCGRGGGIFASAEVISGTCGAEGDGCNLIWSYNSDNGELTISGKGAMADFNNQNVPWATSQLDGEIKKLTVKDGVTSIGSGAFAGGNKNMGASSSFTSVTIPDSVTGIGSGAFSGCENLTDITLSKNLTSIGSHAFYGTGYYNNPENWDNDVLYIGNYLIAAKNSISGKYKVKENTKVIAKRAFSDCRSLTGIMITENVTDIGLYAFLGCTNLSDAAISKSVTNIEVGVFTGCKSLKEITVDSENKNYSSADGVLFNKDKTCLIVYPAGKTEISYSIPQTVTEIGQWSFYYCANLETINIPSGVKTIDTDAFYYSSKLNSVTIPNSVTEIGSGAFSNCTGLASVVISGNITEIGPYTFYRCANLEDIFFRTVLRA